MVGKYVIQDVLKICDQHPKIGSISNNYKHIYALSLASFPGPHTAFGCMKELRIASNEKLGGGHGNESICHKPLPVHVH